MSENVTLSGLTGTFYGEMVQKSNTRFVPEGRGVLRLENKIILGYVKDG